MNKQFKVGDLVIVNCIDNPPDHLYRNKKDFCQFKNKIGQVISQDYGYDKMFRVKFIPSLYSHRGKFEYMPLVYADECTLIENDSLLQTLTI